MSSRWLLVTSLLFAVPVLIPSSALGQDKEAGGTQCVKVHGAFLAQKDVGWESIKVGGKVPKDTLLVSLFESDIRSANGAVDCKLRGDVGEFGPLPAFESAIHLHENPKVDFDLTLDRGIVVLKNAKKEGSARVDLRLRGKTLNIVLSDPGTILGVDLYARHAPGLASIKAEDPTVFLFILNAQGSVEITHGDKTVALNAPPGPALLRWDSILQTPEITHLDKLPEWVKRDEKEQKFFDQINKAAESLTQGRARVALPKLLFSDDPLERKVGLTALGALNSPGAVLATIGRSKHADTRQHAILVLRNWLGHHGDQVKKLGTVFGDAGLNPIERESLVHLLFGFDEDERQVPATYQLLIENLKHSKQLVRELAYWHLSRLAPAGKEIPYDAASSSEDIQRAVQRWRELVPPGQLPPAPKK